MNIFKKSFGDDQTEIKEELKMKIAVICANGRAGKLIVKEAVNRV